MLYVFHDQAGTIPGVPGVFSHCWVEVGEDGSVNVLPVPLSPVIDSTIEPMAEETTSQEQSPALDEPIEQASTTQEEEVVPETNNAE